METLIKCYNIKRKLINTFNYINVLFKDRKVKHKNKHFQKENSARFS